MPRPRESEAPAEPRAADPITPVASKGNSKNPEADAGSSGSVPAHADVGMASKSKADAPRFSWLADRFTFERDADESQEAIELASDEDRVTLPHLGPLLEGADSAAAVSEFDGRIVDLTDATAGYAPMYSYSGEPYALHLFPQGLIYRSYLAGVKESRFRSVWHNEHNSHGHDIWDISLGGNVGILRFGTRGDTRPEGMQLGIEGAGLTRLDRDNEYDVAATDYRFGIPLTWGDSIYQTKVAYYHLSSHVGDEFILKNPTFNRLNYSRDVFVWGHSLYPSDSFRVYAEMGYAFYHDVAEPWEFQFGVDYGPPGRTGARGAPFAAFNGHLREEVDFGGNFVVQTGWAWRRSPASGLYRIGLEYYNGKDDQFSYFNDSVQKFGVGMWYDY
ncbi:MAG TPA: DUF1207 domain-containing protein [Lacipirellula sp.]